MSPTSLVHYRKPSSRSFQGRELGKHVSSEAVYVILNIAKVYTVEEKDAVGKELFGLIASGQLKINIYGEYPFTAEGVRAAQQDLVGGKTTGKLLIKVAEE